MNLQQLNENYNEHILSEEYLVEGLKVFKKSKKLYNFANKIDKKIIKLKDKSKSEDLKIAEKLSKDVKKLADNFKAVEDAFRDKELDKSTAKQKLKSLQKEHEVLLSYVKKEGTKSALKKIGLAGLVGGLVAALGSLTIPAGLIQSAGAAVAKGVGVLGSALPNASGQLGGIATGAARGVMSSSGGNS